MPPSKKTREIVKLKEKLQAFGEKIEDAIVAEAGRANQLLDTYPRELMWKEVSQKLERAKRTLGAAAAAWATLEARNFSSQRVKQTAKQEVSKEISGTFKAVNETIDNLAEFVKSWGQEMPSQPFADGEIPEALSRRSLPVAKKKPLTPQELFIMVQKLSYECAKLQRSFEIGR